MGFFATRKKKSDNIKTLSETEIQQKLYGHLRIPRAAVVDSVFTHRRPAESSKDFSRKSQAPAESLKTQEPFAAQKTVSAGIAAELVRPKAGRGDSVPAANLSPQRPKPEIQKNLLAPVFGALLVFFKGVLFVSLTALFKLTGSVLRFFISIDFRKPQIRKIASVLGAAAFVALLFLSIHFLNVRREAAMKSPHHKTAPEIVTRRVPFTPVKPAAKAPETIPAKASNRLAEIPVEEPAITAKSEAELHLPAAAISAAADVPVSQQPLARPKSTAPQGAYSIQIATFAAREDASRLVTKLLREQDADAFIKELDRPGGRTYYCVFVGHYKDFREGEESLARFRKKSLAKPFLDAFVRTLKTE